MDPHKNFLLSFEIKEINQGDSQDTDEQLEKPKTGDGGCVRQVKLAHTSPVPRFLTMKQARCISRNDVNSAIEVLFNKSSNSILDILRQDINKNEELKNLIKEVFNLRCRLNC